MTPRSRSVRHSDSVWRRYTAARRMASSPMDRRCRRSRSSRWAAAGCTPPSATTSRFTRMMLNGGTLNGARVLAPDTVAAHVVERNGRRTLPPAEDRRAGGVERCRFHRRHAVGAALPDQPESPADGPIAPARSPGRGSPIHTYWIDPVKRRDRRLCDTDSAVLRREGGGAVPGFRDGGVPAAVASLRSARRTCTRLPKPARSRRRHEEDQLGTAADTTLGGSTSCRGHQTLATTMSITMKGRNRGSPFEGAARARPPERRHHAATACRQRGGVGRCPMLRNSWASGGRRHGVATMKRRNGSAASRKPSSSLTRPSVSGTTPVVQA